MAGQPEGAIPICCKENTCLIFDRRLWHTASPNWSEHNMRLACFAGYGSACPPPGPGGSV